MMPGLAKLVTKIGQISLQKRKHYLHGASEIIGKDKKNGRQNFGCSDLQKKRMKLEWEEMKGKLENRMQGAKYKNCYHSRIEELHYKGKDAHKK